MSNKLKIGILDADLVGRHRHRFPNLACMKISSYWKEQEANVDLLLNYDNLSKYDKVFISKVFTDTPFPKEILKLNNVTYGGTGFYFDKAPNLQPEIEHHFPDYALYDKFIKQSKYDLTEFKEYTDYSIGFATRGCFRKCEFCVNRKYKKVFKSSPIEEFYDPDRKKICLLDDNVFGYPKWKDIFKELIDIDKPFKFKQGLDERLLNEEKCELLFNSKYDGDYTFAFDNIEDYSLIESKLKLIRKYSNSTSIKFYVLTGFESTDLKDIENMWKRIALLMKYRCLPYIMRFQDQNYSPWKVSKYKDVYTTIARWCNQPNFFKKKSFREFCIANQEKIKTNDYICSSLKALQLIEAESPKLAKKYFDMRFDDYE